MRGVRFCSQFARGIGLSQPVQWPVFPPLSFCSSCYSLEDEAIARLQTQLFKLILMRGVRFCSQFARGIGLSQPVQWPVFPPLSFCSSCYSLEDEAIARLQTQLFKLILMRGVRFCSQFARGIGLSQPVQWPVFPPLSF